MNERKQTRRGFFSNSASFVGKVGVTGGLVAGYAALRNSGQQPGATRAGLGIIRPPGSVDEPGFMAKCIRCTRCSDACEADCIDFFASGTGKLQGTPFVMPIKKACTLCLLCGEACPTGAIEPIEKKEDAKMGLAVVDKRLCVSHNRTGYCGACFTVCPLRGKAVIQGLHLAPEIDEEHCTGCGLCEEHCIVDEGPGLRAIQVTSERQWPDPLEKA